MSLDLLRYRNTRIVKAIANSLGFDYCGIAKAALLEAEAPRLEQWLKQGKHGKMTYMENYFDKRLDPRLLVPGAKSVVSLMLNYYTKEKQLDNEAPKLSKYAYGEDYHFVIKRKLKEFLKRIQEEIGEVGGRVFVDSAPVMDKAWAERSGMGWIGKHTNLINKKKGSFFFIAELIIDLELDYDTPDKDHCGTCSRCIDACPTDAIEQPYVVNGSKCISYLTIELKDNIIPVAFKDQMDNWMFGCDICQDVCPWNRFSTPHNEPAFLPNEKLLSMNKREWKELTEEVFQELFKISAVKRTKLTGLKRNISFLKD
jgi:epoxyqueuosine reductase